MKNPPLSTEFMTGDNTEPRLVLILGDESCELTAEEALKLAAHLTEKAREMVQRILPDWIAEATRPS